MAARRLLRVGSAFKIDGSFSLFKLWSRQQEVLNSVNARMNQTPPRPPRTNEEVNITFENGDKSLSVKGYEGDSIANVVFRNIKELKVRGYGVCGGTQTCSTCHIILSEEDYARLPHKPSDDELFLLEVAPCVCNTSRLGCQIFLTKKLDGLKVKIPPERRDVRQILGEAQRPEKTDLKKRPIKNSTDTNSIVDMRGLLTQFLGKYGYNAKR